MPKWIWIPLAVVVLIALVFAVFSSSGEDRVEVSLDQFLADAVAGEVTRVEVDDRTIYYDVENDSTEYTTEMERGDNVRTILQENGVSPGTEDYPEVVIKESSGWQRVFALVFTFLPIILIVAAVFYFLRRSRRSDARSRVTNLDPVCGQTVNPSSSAGSSTFRDVTYYFCSDEHKARFDADPVSFLLKK